MSRWLFVLQEGGNAEEKVAPRLRASCWPSSFKEQQRHLKLAAMYSWKNTSCSWLLSDVGPIANPVIYEQCYHGPSVDNSTGKALVGYGDKQEDAEEGSSSMPHGGPKLEPEGGDDVDQLSAQQLHDMSNKCRLARQESSAATTAQYTENKTIKRSASPPPINKPPKKIRHGKLQLID